jgi:hypothetical protein
MSYNPNDHTVTARQILAGWVVCLGGRQAISVANADDPPYARAAAERCPLSGVRLPSFAACAVSREGGTKLAQARAPIPAEHCG